MTTQSPPHPTPPSGSLSTPACLISLLVVRGLQLHDRRDRTSLLVFSKQNLEGQRSPSGGDGGRLDCSSSLLGAHEQELDFYPSPV